jgi:hypothetical protein
MPDRSAFLVASHEIRVSGEPGTMPTITFTGLSERG